MGRDRRQFIREKPRALNMPSSSANREGVAPGVWASMTMAEPAGCVGRRDQGWG